MLSNLESHRLVRDAKKQFAAVPGRIRFVVGIVVFVVVFVYLAETTSFRAQPAVHHGYVAGPGGNWSSFENIIAFGDSWTATGFLVNGTQPSPQNPLGNPEVPENGKSHPPKWVHYLAMQYNSSYIRTYNLAHGAATIDRTAVPPHEFFNHTKTFREQVDETFALGYTGERPVATWNPDTTLFAIWFGVVDISLLVDRQQYLGEHVLKMMNAFTSIIERLYEFGGRHFLLLTAPPMYLSPSAHDDGHNPFLERLMIKEFNGRLFFYRKEFMAAHPDAQMYIFDAHGLMTTVIQRPESTPMTIRLRNTTGNCWDYNPDGYPDPKPWDWFLEDKCGIPFDQYLWANHLHPTHVFHNATAAAIVSDCMAPRRKGFCS